MHVPARCGTDFAVRAAGALRGAVLAVRYLRKPVQRLRLRTEGHREVEVWGARIGRFIVTDVLQLSYW